MEKVKKKYHSKIIQSRMEMPYHVGVPLRDTNLADKMNQFLPWTRFEWCFGRHLSVTYSRVREKLANLNCSILKSKNATEQKACQQMYVRTSHPDEDKN